jgi:nitrogen-specific signal transduction histidine kinase
VTRSRSRRARNRAPQRSSATALDAGAVLPFFDRTADLNALDRMVAALAVHPAGAGFERAHLLVWNPDLDCLVGRLSWSAGGPLSLGPALLLAQRQGNEGLDPEATRALRARSWRVEELPADLRPAWTAGIAVITDSSSADLPWSAAAQVGAAGIARGRHAYAVVVGEWSSVEDPAERLRVLENLRRLAIAALDAQAAAAAAHRRSDQLGALAELARAAVSPHNLAELFHLGCRAAAQVTGARGAALWTRSPQERTALACSHGPLGSRERIARALEPLAAAVVREGQVQVIERATSDPRLAAEIAAQITALVAVPISAYGQVRGTLAVYDRGTFHPSESIAFDREEVAFLGALCDLLALAVAEAGREDEVRVVGERRRELEARLAQLESMAAACVSWSRVGREARNPIAAIGAFARRVQRGLGEGALEREYLEVVIREADRLEHMMGEQLLAEPPPRSRLRLESLNEVVQEVLQEHGEALVRRRVRLLKKLAPDVPPLLLDRDRIRRAVDNVVARCLEAVAPGGRVRIECRRVHQHVVLEIANDGAPPNGALMEQLFVPFALGRRGTEDVGLSAAHQLVRQQGGEVRVRSEAEWSAIFTLVLPVRENGDRRRTMQDRRRNGDRRARKSID